MSAVALATWISSSAISRGSVRSAGMIRTASFAIIALPIVRLAAAHRLGLARRTRGRELRRPQAARFVRVRLCEALFAFDGIFVERQPAVAIDIQLGEIAIARGKEFIPADLAVLVVIGSREALFLAC